MAALAAGALLCASAVPASASPRVTLATVPQGTTVAQLAGVPGLSLGLMSAGIGEVSAERTYRDISAGNREPPPSDAVPGLLRSTVARAGLARSYRMTEAPLAELERLVSGLRGDDLLIVFAVPPPAAHRALPIGIAGAGYRGTLTSDSTRTDGYVLSTDIAPTVLSRLHVPIPGEMNGERIRAVGSVDVPALEGLGDRMAAIPDRRGPMLVAVLASWIALAGAVAARLPAARRTAAAWLALAFAYLPLLLLLGAAIQPSAVAEGVLVGAGAAGLAALTLRLAPGWWALTVACTITVLACAIDVIAGSGLTRLSLLGPNPIYGARFYGIGNELEALFAVIVPVGVGAGLTAKSGWGRGLDRRAAVAAFLAAGALGAIVFGAGRFGADVGAAIVLPLGAAVAAASLLAQDLVDFSGYRPGKSTKLDSARVLAAIVAAPFIALVFLALIDLVSGADAHLTRSVFDAGGATDLADVAERRLRLSAHDFADAAANPLFWLVVAGIGLAIVRRRRIDAWLRPFPAARAGLLGACAAVAVGVLVNDSGGTYLALGGLALGAFLAYAWSQQVEHRSEGRVTSATKPGPPMRVT